MSEALPAPAEFSAGLPILYTHNGFHAVFKPGTPMEDREYTLDFLLALDERNPFIIGSLVNQTKRELGESHAQIAKDTPYAARTLSNYSWVEQRIPPENRCEGLGISLWQVIAGFKDPAEQRVWIDRVLESGMNRRELREAKREEEELHAGLIPTTDGKEPIRMVQCPTCLSTVPETALHGEE